MDIFTLKYVLRNLVLPPAGPLILAILGLILSHCTRLRRTGTALCAVGLTALWLLAMPIMSDILTRASEHYPALDLGRVPQADAVVILAGGVRPNAPEYGTWAPNPTTLQRLTYGARVARATKLPVLVSGGRHEAVAMGEFLERDFGVDVKWVENHSRDTHQNAQLSAVILKNAHVSTIVLVTTAAHMTRAVAEFRATGLAVVAAPTGLWTPLEYGPQRWVPNADALRRSQGALYEALGNVVLTLRDAL
jgi:uncharacterized SAM-binding protein YcdF (DUF218 family)